MKKKVQGEKAGAIFHFVGSDMMKYLISDSVERGFRRTERIVEHMKWNREGGVGVGDIGGLG